MKLLNLLSAVALIGTTWLLTGCGDSANNLEGIEPCPESFVMNGKTKTCEPKGATLDYSTTYSCPDGMVWSKGNIDAGKCVSQSEDNLLTQAQTQILKRLNIEYPIDDLTGLSFSKAFESDEFFLQESKYGLGTERCVDATCYQVPTKSVCENGFELRGKQLSNGNLHVACIPKAVTYGFMQRTDPNSGHEIYCPTTKEGSAIWFGRLLTKPDGTIYLSFECSFLTTKSNA